MKTVFCRVHKAPKIGDEVRVYYTHKVRGGMTEAAITIKRDHFWRKLKEGEGSGNREVWNYQPDPDVPAIVHVKMTDKESIEAIAADLADAMSKQWMGDLFSCRVRSDEIIITTSVDDHDFFPLVNGTGVGADDVLSIER